MVGIHVSKVGVTLTVRVELTGSAENGETILDCSSANTAVAEPGLDTAT